MIHTADPVKPKIKRKKINKTDQGNQLDLFPDDVRMERIEPEDNAYRFYRLRIQPDLFGGASVLREWGAIGTCGRARVDLYADAGQACDALVRRCQLKGRRGYSVVQTN